MSADSAGATRRPPGRVRSGLVFVGHYAYVLLLAAFAGKTVNDVLRYGWGGSSWEAGASGAVAWASVTLTVLSGIGFALHEQTLCVREVDASPVLNPAGAVSRRMRELRFAHLVECRGVPVAFALALLPGMVAAFAVSAVLGGRVPWWLLVLDVAALASAAWGLWSATAHLRLGLWCPFCTRREA